jgi:hypothetical protein
MKSFVIVQYQLNEKRVSPGYSTCRKPRQFLKLEFLCFPFWKVVQFSWIDCAVSLLLCYFFHCESYDSVVRDPSFPSGVAAYSLTRKSSMLMHELEQKWRWIRYKRSRLEEVKGTNDPRSCLLKSSRKIRQFVERQRLCVSKVCSLFSSLLILLIIIFLVLMMMMLFLQEWVQTHDPWSFLQETDNSRREG